MPLADLRICTHCNHKIRWAACSTVCKIGPAGDPDSWRENMQHGAGTNGAKETHQ